MHRLAERVLSQIRRKELLHAGDRVGVAVSGGIDSVALLRLLLDLREELGIVVSVVHFNHKLRGAESDADQEFVAALARSQDLEFHSDSDDVGGHAEAERISLEAAARELRYGFFHYLLGADAPGAEDAAQPKSGPQGLKPPIVGAAFGTTEVVPFQDSALSLDSGSESFLTRIVTGHTLDDQAETVLLRIIRGSGVTGLGSIHPRIAVENDAGDFCGEIVRPLLGVRRRDLEQYLGDIGQSWREDSTNSDEGFTRNRLRKLVMPLLEKEFNPAVAENLAELADIARGEEDYWQNEVSGWIGTTVQWSEPEWASSGGNGSGLIQIEAVREKNHDSGLQSRIDSAGWLVMNASVSRVWFLGEPLAVQRRVVKAIGEQAGIPLAFKHVEDMLRIATEEGSCGKELSLPLGWRMVREADELLFLTPDLREGQTASSDYEYELAVPGQVSIPEAGCAISVKCIPSATVEAGYNPEHLLDAASLAGPLRVRNWRPGDRFWPAHTKSPKKIKELLQERHVAQPERKVWPVVTCGDEIVWLRGFRTPAKWQGKPGRPAVLIEVLALGGDLKSKDNRVK